MEEEEAAARVRARGARFLNNYNEGNYPVRRQAECDESLLHIAARKMIVPPPHEVNKREQRKRERKSEGETEGGGRLKEVDEQGAEGGKGGSEGEGEREDSAWQADPLFLYLLFPLALFRLKRNHCQSLPPPRRPKTLATFLFARFSPASRGPLVSIMPRGSLRMLNANLPPRSPSQPPFVCLLRGPYRTPPPRKTVAPRGTAGQRLRGIFDACGSCLDPLASDSAGNYA